MITTGIIQISAEFRARNQTKLVNQEAALESHNFLDTQRLKHGD